MQPTLDFWNVRARCPDCDGAVTSFEYQTGGKEFGLVIDKRQRQIADKKYTLTVFKLLRCAGCGRGGLVEVATNDHNQPQLLTDFFPRTIDTLLLSASVPEGITKEFREAERCASISAWRGASALFRSTLEKVLKANGFKKGTLEAKIDEAAADGVITEPRRKRAHEDIRVLGNDVLHDEWREVTPEEVEASHKYVQRVLEDLYDDRPSVEAILKAKGRIT